MTYDNEQRKTLIELAERSIRYAVSTGEPPFVDPSVLGGWAEQQRATFVTVYLGGGLQGCIGTMQPRRPLAQDIVSNAWRASMHDPRFSAVRPDQIDGVSVHIAVLGPLAKMEIANEADLLRQLRPGTDGLLIDDGIHRATFLPAVWQKVKSPEQFLLFLKRKAGLATGWPPAIQAFRYEVEEFNRETLV